MPFRKKKPEPQKEAPQEPPLAPLAHSQCVFYDGMLCPLSHVLMTDPVIAADGEAYDRSAISEWFLRGNMVSPVTGEPLRNTNLFPNHNLRRATTHLALSDHSLLAYVRLGTQLVIPPSIPSTIVSQYQVHRCFVHPKSKAMGDDVELINPHTLKRRFAKECATLIDATTFIEGPLRYNDAELPQLGVEVLTTRTHTSMLQIGLCTVSPDAWKYDDMQDLIDSHSYYFDYSGSLQRPAEIAELSKWPNARYLKPGDSVRVGLGPDGNFWLSENNQIVVDYPMKAPLFKSGTEIQNYWGFVTLFGTVTSVRLLPNLNFTNLKVPGTVAAMP